MYLLYWWFQGMIYLILARQSVSERPTREEKSYASTDPEALTMTLTAMMGTAESRLAGMYIIAVLLQPCCPGNEVDVRSGSRIAPQHG
jgi:hypothetical protein